MTTYSLPALDTHAHIAPDVTADQVAALGHAHVLAMTRTLDEAEAVRARRDAPLTWALGVHPGRPDALKAFDLDRFKGLLGSFAIVGEIGLDKRGSLEVQTKVLGDVLRACHDAPVLVSIHSAGRVSATVDLLQAVAVHAPVLHWFLGSESDLAIAVQSGAYFSVNAAMSRDLVRAIPADRVLTESDFPARGTRAQRPGDVAAVEKMLAEAWGVPQDVARYRVWVNFKRLLIASGAIDRVSDALADHALSV